MLTATLPNFGQRVTSRRRTPIDREMVVDNFAGAGGASLGIEAALGCAVDVAINHSPLAIETHVINHPATKHYTCDVWEVDPLEATKGRPIGLAWFSPDCKHFSRAKGGKPVEKRIRSLAWVVVKWARLVRPRVIILENVPEFQTWGPLTADKKPCPRRKGQTFRKWCSQLKGLGYEIEMRDLVAADYGVPTIRKRFFLIARCDGQPIVWPERTHAPRAKAEALGLKPWRAAAECIDWTLACPSIFERKRPLAEATMRRIAAGVRRYVIECAEPFIVTCNHEGGAPRSIHEPMRTLTASRDAHGVVAPLIATLAHGDGPPGSTFAASRATSMHDPIGTVHAGGGNHALVAPLIAQVQNASNPNGCHEVARPFPTVTAHPKGGGHTLVSATLQANMTNNVPHSPSEPLGTITASNRHEVVQAFLAQFNNHQGTHQHDGRSLADPLSTVATRGPHQGLVAAHLSTFRGTSKAGADVAQPMPALTGGGNHIADVRAFLVAYFGSEKDGQSCRVPMRTVTVKERFGLVTVAGQDYQIVDIGLRMLAPRELLRAQFGRFADEFVLVGTKSQQVAAIGNSVPPELAEALVKANVKLQRVDRSAAA